MRTVYHLEYVITDKLGRTKQIKHAGVYSSIEEVDKVKATINSIDSTISFKVYIIEHLFS